MKITESQLTEMVKKQLIKALNEAKYKKMYSIVNEALNSDPRFSYNEFGKEGIDDETGEESFPVKVGSEDAPLQHLHINKWGDYNPDMDDLFGGKKEDNEDSWDELDTINQDITSELGSNAQDIYDGNYETKPDGTNDYFNDSDYRFTTDYWNNDHNQGNWDDLYGNTLGDIQRSNITDIYDQMGESKIREMIKSKLRESINEKRYSKMYDLVRKNIVECLKSEDGKKFIAEAMKNKMKPIETPKSKETSMLESIIKKHVRNSIAEALK